MRTRGWGPRMRTEGCRPGDASTFRPSLPFAAPPSRGKQPPRGGCCTPGQLVLRLGAGGRAGKRPGAARRGCRDEMLDGFPFAAGCSGQGGWKRARGRLLGTGLGSVLPSGFALAGTPEGSGLRGAASERRRRMLQPVGGRGRKGDVFN